MQSKKLNCSSQSPRCKRNSRLSQLKIKQIAARDKNFNNSDDALDKNDSILSERKEELEAMRSPGRDADQEIKDKYNELGDDNQTPVVPLETELTKVEKLFKNELKTTQAP